jgi:hypothetical protein
MNLHVASVSARDIYCPVSALQSVRLALLLKARAWDLYRGSQSFVKIVYTFNIANNSDITVIKWSVLRTVTL